MGVERDWLHQRDAAAIGDALRSLITELFGWSEPHDDELRDPK